ncbi:MAG: hypothetical protein J6A17_00940 [Bacilli bacterium]|nr:hypothetical protein [Bacilli bacterium]
MYIVVPCKVSKKSKITLHELNGISFGMRNRSYKINNQSIINIVIYNKKFAYPFAKKQVDNKFKKLMLILPELLIDDDEDGECIREALNHIERFRQIIKNKYRSYLKQKDLEVMSNKLMLLQQEAKKKFTEIQNSKFIGNTRSSRK